MEFLILLGIVAAVVYGVTRLRRRHGFAETDPGIGTVRRLYFYVVTFVALMIGVNGVVQLASFVLEGVFGGDEVSTSTTRQAIGLSMTFIGLPLWAFHWRLIVKQVRRLPVETRSVIRKLYLYLALAVAAGFALQAAVSLLHIILRTSDFKGYPWAALLIWGGVWAFHWRLEAKEGQQTFETRAIRRLYIYATAAIALVLAAAGLGQIVHIILREAYDGLVSSPVVAKSGLWGDPTREALAGLLVLGAAWVGHWVYFARGDHDSILRQLYVYVLAMFVGAVTVFVALAMTLHSILQWTIGVPDESAAEHFRFIPGALSFTIIGGGVLAYHWAAANREARGPSPEARGAHDAFPYALAGLGLIALSLGISMLANTVIGVAVDRAPAVFGEELLMNSIARVISVGVLAVPLWWYYWTAVQRRAEAGGVQVRNTLSRRAFIFLVLGAGMLALVVSLSFVLFVFLRELLEGDLSEFVRDARVGISIMAPVAIFLPYYWMVYRADRQAAREAEPEEKPRVRKAVTVLASEDGMPLVSRLEALLGYEVSPLRWADPESSAPEISERALQDLARRIGEASGPNVLLVPEGATVRVLSYD